MTDLTPVQEKLFKAARAQVQALRATATTARIATMLIPSERFDPTNTDRRPPWQKTHAAK